jgi:hypothetical protein
MTTRGFKNCDKILAVQYFYSICAVVPYYRTEAGSEFEGGHGPHPTMQAIHL